MAFIQQPALAVRPVGPHTVIRPRHTGPTTVRPITVGPWTHPMKRIPGPLGAIQPDADLTRYPNGQPLKTVGMGSFVRVQGPDHSAHGRPMLSGYESAPDLTQYTNGRPLPTIGNQTPKSALVLLAFDRCMSKKRAKANGNRCACSASVPTMSKHRRRGGMMGLGDSNSDIQAISDAANAIQDSVDATASAGIDTSSVDTSSVPFNGSILYSGPAPMSTIAGAPQVQVPTATGIGQSIANIFSSLFRPSGYSTIPAYSSVGSGLSSPLYQGSPISTGGLLLGAAGLVLVIVLARKR